MIGFCRGGRSVWIYAAHSPALKAGVAFYGSLVDPQNSVLAEESDPACAGDEGARARALRRARIKAFPSAQVEEMKEALKAAGKTAEIKIYPGAPHGFHADYRPSYSKEAAEDAWKRMIDWFKTYKVLS